jgi:hypothetical protein
MKPEEPGLVKLIVGVLFSEPGLMERGLSMLSEKFGPIDYRSPEFPFDQTDYYVPEMGSPIRRLFVSFVRLIHPRDLAATKIATNEMEERLAGTALEQAPPGGAFRRRKVNLDPGYMDYDKLVLASAKYNGQKIYLDLGIWADLTLHYEKGRFDPYPWSFPDFKSRLYDSVFLEIRRRFKLQRKQ